MSYIYNIISLFSKNFYEILNKRGCKINTGRNIKDLLINYREKIIKINPFSVENYSDEKIMNSIKNCEGNHMSFPSPPIQVIEMILSESQYKPLSLIFEPSKDYLNKIMNEIVILINILIDEIGIIRFPDFTKKIKNKCINDILLDNFYKTLNKIKEQINIQENYIWTDNLNFNKLLKNEENLTTLELMRELLKQYFNTYILVMQDIIPKIIMFNFIKKTEIDINEKLYNFIKNENINQLLSEYKEIHNERIKLEQTINDLNNAKEIIESTL